MQAVFPLAQAERATGPELAKRIARALICPYVILQRRTMTRYVVRWSPARLALFPSSCCFLLSGYQGLCLDPACRTLAGGSAVLAAARATQVWSNDVQVSLAQEHPASAPLSVRDALGHQQTPANPCPGLLPRSVMLVVACTGSPHRTPSQPLCNMAQHGMVCVGGHGPCQSGAHCAARGVPPNQQVLHLLSSASLALHCSASCPYWCPCRTRMQWLTS